jgi:quercetin dioxygenase-like cupin family protein
LIIKMKLDSFPFQTLNWSSVPKEEHKGETGLAYWQMQMMNDIRVRMVEYSPGYKADHWCSKGHIILCTEGEMETELEDGRILKLSKGMTYFVGDNCEAHRSSSKSGCKLFIVD